MTLEVVFRPAARAELTDATSWYENRRPGLGIQLLSEVGRSVDLASRNPERYPIRHEQIRCVRVRRFPYSIFYIVEAERIVVLAVFHARRDPTIWKARA